MSTHNKSKIILSIMPRVDLSDDAAPRRQYEARLQTSIQFCSKPQSVSLTADSPTSSYSPSRRAKSRSSRSAKSKSSRSPFRKSQTMRPLLESRTQAEVFEVVRPVRRKLTTRQTTETPRVAISPRLIEHHYQSLDPPSKLSTSPCCTLRSKEGDVTPKEDSTDVSSRSVARRSASLKAITNSKERFCVKLNKALSEHKLIPPHYLEAALLENIPPVNIEALFTENGFEISRCFAVLRYRKDIIEEFRCRLIAHKYEPIFKLDNLTEQKSRLLLPNLKIGPTTSSSALDAFAFYSWPRGDRQLQDMKHICGVMCTFRNLREPIYFATPDTDQQKLADCLTVVRRVAIQQDLKRRQAYLSRTHEPPPHLASQGFRSMDHSPTFDATFAEALNRCSKKLATVKAVEKYWNRERDVFTIYWHDRPSSHGKYNCAKMHIYIDSESPNLVISNRKGAYLSDVLDLTTLSCSRHLLGNNKDLPSCITHNSKAPHICFMECLNHDKRMCFSFSTSEDLKDFTQVVATLSHMQTSQLI
eukprot:Protomagalhaensia_wolfi_Nauph_80__6023@NODE_825_length_1973_cov_38_957084_g620_i0_p1_GENE_NODE_825_length_1973_cov_38_957084_g620_i0NODE_825_length_1973_cov_38_957084_g620_i0_p1_ORF_typecomplete_len530_score66_53_NODE_825_length_1973_cov_38_957084_g620_i03301919